MFGMFFETQCRFVCYNISYLFCALSIWLFAYLFTVKNFLLLVCYTHVDGVLSFFQFCCDSVSVVLQFCCNVVAGSDDVASSVTENGPNNISTRTLFLYFGV